MKLQKNTLVLLLLAIGLGSYVFVTEDRAAETEPSADEPTVEAPTAARKTLFAATATDLTTLEIARSGSAEPLRFVKRAGEEAESTAWQMVSPQEGSVTEASIAFLTDVLLAETEAGLRSFEVERALLGEYGLEEPLATLVLTWDSGDASHLALGSASFDGQSLYARLDPPGDGEEDPETVEVVLVDIDLQYAVERPVEEWLAPAAGDHAEDAGDEAAADPDATTLPADEELEAPDGENP